MATGPRAHGATPKNTSTITFRYPSGPPRVLLVHGRRSEVDNAIRTAVEQRKRKISFWDLHSARNVVVDLDKVDTWSVK